MPSIEVRSGNGRIELILPERGSFQLEATAERGEAINDFGPPIQKQTEGRTAILKGSVGTGPTVHVTASRGSVEVRKEGTSSSEITPPEAPRPPQTPKDLKDSEIKM